MTSLNDKIAAELDRAGVSYERNVNGASIVINGDDLAKLGKETKVPEGTIAADELRLLVERIERLQEEKKAIADDVKDVYSEAKSRGYDTKTIRAIVRLRGMETHVRQEAEALLDTYKAALGIG